MPGWRQKIVSYLQRLSPTGKLRLAAVLLLIVFWCIVLILKGCVRSEPVYSVFSESPTAVRPKLLLSYNAFVPEGIQECYLEVFFVREEGTFLRMQHPGYQGESVIEFDRMQTEQLKRFIDKYLRQLDEDRKDRKKTHMVGTFHEPTKALDGRSLSIVVDYTGRWLQYRLFFGNDGMSPVLSLDQLQQLREAVANALEKE